jgi:hypothetical protein
VDTAAVGCTAAVGMAAITAVAIHTTGIATARPTDTAIIMAAAAGTAATAERERDPHQSNSPALGAGEALCDGIKKEKATPKRRHCRFEETDADLRRWREHSDAQVGTKAPPPSALALASNFR